MTTARLIPTRDVPEEEPMFQSVEALVAHMVQERRLRLETLRRRAQEELDRLDEWGAAQLAIIERDMALSVGEFVTEH